MASPAHSSSNSNTADRPAAAAAASPNGAAASPNGATQVAVEGESNVTMTGAFSIGGDLTIYSQQDEFTSLKLDEYKPPYFPRPRQITHFIRILQSQRLLVLAGASGVDKSDLARHIAWYLSEQLAAAPNGSPSDVPVLEWIRNPNTQRLLIRIQRTEEPTIFLLPDVSSRDLRSDDLERLRRMTNHYIVISTNAAPQDWNLADSARHFWYDLDPEELFAPQELAHTLVQRMIQVRDVLPADLVKNAVAGSALDGQLQPIDIAQRLKTLNKVLVFVYELRGQQQFPNGALDKLVEEIVQRDTTTLDKAISAWFTTMLTPRDRLLALNVSFFTGMLETQFFAALEYLFERVWRQRDPNLIAYDYNDLAQISLYFNLIETRTQERLLEERFPYQRLLLLQAAWPTHRRQILVALPVLAALAHDSIGERVAHPELFGLAMSRNQLRQAISDTISDIGLIDVGAVQQTLIELAADRSIRVQAVAAAAMARWRYFGKDQQLYNTLKSWQTEQRFLDLVMQAAKERVADSSIVALAYVRATVAITVGYASQYDPPNQLAVPLIERFVELAHDPNFMVRDRFRRYTLPLIVPRHLNQIQEELRQLSLADDMPDWIAMSLSEAYKTMPTDVMRTLGLWHNAVDKRSVGRPRSRTISLREATLATIALTYGRIDYAESGGPLSADEAFERLKLILNEEKHFFVRQATLLALLLQAERSFARVEQLLPRVLVELQEQEREQIINALVQMHLHQRAELAGGADSARIGTQIYPIWFPPQRRPLTEIEQVLFRWMKDANNPVVQQIALRTLVKCAAVVEQPLDAIVQQRLIERQQNPKALVLEPSAPAPAPALQRPSWYLTTFVPWMVTGSVPQYRAMIRGLLPEVFLQYRRNQALTTFVVDKLRSVEDTDIQAIAPPLKRALGCYGTGCLFSVVLVMALILVVQVVLLLVGAVV